MNKPAFPGFEYTEFRGNMRKNEFSGENEFYSTGMTMRQYYKAAALKGILGNADMKYDFEGAAHDAGKFADAMLVEDEEFEKRSSR